MAEDELTPDQQSEIAATLSAIIENGKAKTAPAGSFPPPPAAKKESQNVLDDLLRQKSKHRDKLLIFICWMAVVSFLLLALIVILQMEIRVYIPSYTGVSDFVVNVLAVSVFGQIIAIVASIVLAVWKDPELKI